MLPLGIRSPDDLWMSGGPSSSFQPGRLAPLSAPSYPREAQSAHISIVSTLSSFTSFWLSEMARGWPQAMPRNAAAHPSTPLREGKTNCRGRPGDRLHADPTPGSPERIQWARDPAWCDPMRSGAGAACLFSGAALGSGHRQCAEPRRGGPRPGPVPRRAYRGEGGTAGPCGVP